MVKDVDSSYLCKPRRRCYFSVFHRLPYSSLCFVDRSSSTGRLVDAANLSSVLLLRGRLHVQKTVASNRVREGEKERDNRSVARCENQNHPATKNPAETTNIFENRGHFILSMPARPSLYSQVEQIPQVLSSPRTTCDHSSVDFS